MPMLVKTMTGIGDAFAARPTLMAIARKYGKEVFVETPWPEVFADIIGEHNFVKPQPNIECARRNIAETETPWHCGGVAGEKIQLSYSLYPRCDSIPVQIANSARRFISAANVDWDDFFVRESRLGETNEFKRIGVFRQATVRREYRNAARNPEEGVIPNIYAGIKQNVGLTMIHINDCRHDETMLEAPLGDIQAVRGEFGFAALLELVSRARLALTPVSWLAWAAACYRVPTLCVMGGFCGADTIFGQLLEAVKTGSAQDSRFRLLNAQQPCNCFDKDHDACTKYIDSVDALFKLGEFFGRDF
jgi:hypothetical protein